MPLIYLNTPEAIFTANARDALAEELTMIALESEQLPTTPYVKSTTWIYVKEYAPTHVYHGGKSGGTGVISLEVNAFEGGLDAQKKESLITRFTAAIKKHAGIADGALVPVYIILRDVSTLNWGVFGDTIQLDDLRNPPADAEPV